LAHCRCTSFAGGMPMVFFCPGSEPDWQCLSFKTSCLVWKDSSCLTEDLWADGPSTPHLSNTKRTTSSSSEKARQKTNQHFVSYYPLLNVSF
jgi:hypothetical protein